jgi:hypothetical protein
MDGSAALGSHSHPLQIGKPAPPVFVVGMADVIACYRAFAADFTFFCHGKNSFILKNIRIIYAKTGYIHVLPTEGKHFLK